MSVTKMMKTDELFRKTFNKFISENKDIKAYHVQSNKVHILVK